MQYMLSAAGLVSQINACVC